MRIIFAWFFLMIATFQWFGSYFSFSIMRSVIIEHHMDLLEHTVSEKMENETGMKLRLRKTSSEFVERMGYSNIFIVNEKVDGVMVQFIIDDKPWQVIHYEKFTPEPEHNRSSQKNTALLRLILCDFVPQSVEGLSSTPDFIYVKNMSHYNKTLLAGNTSLNTPPPENV